MNAVTFVRTWPRAPATGAEVPVFLAGGGTYEPYRLADVPYRAGIISAPRFAGALGFDQKGWNGGTVPTVSAIGFQPADPALLDSLTALYWNDARIEIDRVAPGMPPVRQLTGLVANAAIRDGALSLTVADLSMALNKPILAAAFTGSGGLDGGDDAAGRMKRRSWGRVFNVEGLLLDKVNNVYEFGDPARGFSDWTALRDKGRDGPFAVLPWAGSADATFAALQASTPAQGGGVVAPSIACAKWWTQPAGPLTADFLGTAADGADVTAPEIAALVSGAASGPTISNVSAMALVRPGVAGLHIWDDSETTAQALDRLLLGVSLLWSLDPAGVIVLRPWTFEAPVESLQAIFVARDRGFTPIKTRRLGYRRNHRVHNDGEIAAVLLYGDGTPIDDLKPTEGGATRNIPGALLQDGVFLDSYWTLGGISRAFSTPISPSGKALEIPFIEGEENWSAYGGSGNRFFEVEPGKRVYLRLTADPEAGDVQPLFDGDEPLFDGEEPLFDNEFAPADWTLQAALEWHDAREVQISRIVVADIGPEAGRQIITAQALPPAGAVLARVAFGHEEATGKVGSWALWSPWVAEHQPSADITALNTPSMEVPVAQQFKSDAAGVIKPGQLPRTLRARRTRGAVDVTALADWSISLANVVATIDNDPESSMRGALTITDVTAASGWIDVTSALDNVELVQRVSVSRTIVQPGLALSGLVTIDIGTSVVNATYGGAIASATLSVGTGENVSASALISYATYDDVGRLAGKWRHSPAGTATWTDMGSEISGSFASFDGGRFDAVEGYATIAQGVSGLAAGDYDIELLVRINAGSASELYAYGQSSIEVF